MAFKPKGPRVIIATLFLPETVSFDEPLPSPSLSLSTHIEFPVTQEAGSSPVAFPSSSSSNAVPTRKSTGGLTPIHSGHATPSIIQGSRAASPEPDNVGLGVPVQPLLAAIAKQERPDLNRGMSIVKDLQTKGTGVVPTQTPAITPGVTDLGTNPFDLMSPAMSPQPTGTGAAASTATGRKSPQPAGKPAMTLTRLTGEGTKSPSLSIGNAGNAFTSSSRRPSGTYSRPTSLLDNGLGAPQTSTSRGSPDSGRAAPSGLSDLAARMTDYSMQRSASASNLESESPRMRRRSSSAARGAQPGGYVQPTLSRTFSRSRKPGADAHRRRRSSASIDTVSGLSGLHYGGPAFYFEGNPHGNGGLQKAVRSVADVHLRTHSDPTNSTSAGIAGVRSGTAAPPTPAPATKATIGEYTWVGTIGCGIADFDDGLRKSVERRYIEEKRSAVVWVEDEILEPAYDSFCKQVLWGTFHYQMHDVYKVGKSRAYEKSAWQAYVSMNQSFADKIVATYRQEDHIWVNDYHLLLVPQMIRAKLPEANIGFFLHIAFPSSEIFRCLANRRELLEGVLGADLVGFQTYNTARHFRQTCQRLLSLEATPKGIQTESGFTKVGVFPIGIDVKSLHERKKDYEVSEWVQFLKERYAGQRVIIGRDKLDEIKGLKQKLVAFEAFLEKYPEWLGKVVLIQVAMATALENEKQGEVMDVVARINTRFSSLTYQPVVFLHQDVSFSQYLALLTIADCFINSSLREGMNLTSHEFVICQEGHWAPLILSEFTGSYSRTGFQRCIPINPYDKLQCRDAIHEALTMPEEERISRWRDLERHVWSQTAQHWCTGFVTALQREIVDVKTRPASSSAAGSQSQPPEFDAQRAVWDYNLAQKRLLLIDFEDTLVPDVTHHRKHAKKGLLAQATEHDHRVLLDSETEQALDKLSGDKKNTAYLMSGKAREDLAALVQRFPNLGFIAENGCFVATPTTTTAALRTWHKLVEGTHQTWRAPVLEILQYYTVRTPGSYIDDRGVSIVWRYANTENRHPTGSAKKRRGSNVPAQRGADIGLIKDDDEISDEPPRYEHGQGNEAYHWARRQAAEVQNHIMDSLGERFGLQLYPGATSFLILPRKAGRAIAVAHILQAQEFGGNFGGADEAVDDTTPSTDDAEQQQQPDEASGTSGAESPAVQPGEAATKTAKSSGISEVNRATASKRLLEQFDYVLSLGEDQRLCAWLEEMALDKVVTVSVGGKRRGARWHLSGPEEVKSSLQVLAKSTQ